MLIKGLHIKNHYFIQTQLVFCNEEKMFWCNKRHLALHL